LMSDSIYYHRKQLFSGISTVRYGSIGAIRISPKQTPNGGGDFAGGNDREGWKPDAQPRPKIMCHCVPLKIWSASSTPQRNPGHSEPE
ncbi:MAG: hypothetical protein P8Y76_09010, partial [bacterium]